MKRKVTTKMNLNVSKYFFSCDNLINFNKIFMQCKKEIFIIINLMNSIVYTFIFKLLNQEMFHGFIFIRGIAVLSAFRNI